MLSRIPLFAVTGAVLLATAAAACASAGDGPASGAALSPVAATPSCTGDSLATQAYGKLTVGTQLPAYAPWFAGGNPYDGKGFESAVAYQVANRLGFTKADVKWTSVRFGSALSPGPKTFDFAINEFSITPERVNAVDFSSPYYLVPRGTGVPEKFGLVLTKNSKLTSCVSQAVDQLRQDGTLAVLEKTWLPGAGQI